MSLEFNTTTEIVAQSYLNIADHGLGGNVEVRYETGDNETPVSIGIGPGIYYAFLKDANNFYLLDPASENISYFLGGFDQLINVAGNSLFVQNSFSTGDPVIYTSGGGTDIGGLSSWSKYWVIGISSTQIQLASSLFNSQNNVPIVITTIGSGYSHCLFKHKTLTPSVAPQTHRINPTFRSNDVLIIRSITTIERNNLTPLVNGMVIYNQTIHKFQGRENGAWVNLYEQP